MECGYGGIVPLREGTEAELIVEANDIAKEDFLKAITEPGRHLALKQGTKLLVGLSVRDHPGFKPIKNAPLIELAPWPKGPIVLASGYSGTYYFTKFIKIELSVPTEKQIRLHGSKVGGLWLLTKGRKATGLSSTTIELPPAVSDETATSLNHALTILSEKFETWRISHTGNVYEQVFYQEKNERWYALDYLRNEKVERIEMEIADKLWSDFLGKMSPSAFRTGGT
jgi:hypothetical protein